MKSRAISMTTTLPCLVKRTVLSLVAVSLLGWSGTLALASDPDLSNPSPNIELIQAGSLVIPMDNDLQNLAAGHFNLRAYGLVNSLLHNGVPVKWIIRAGKGKDSADFSANSRQVYPTEGAIGTFSFLAGPFVVPNCYTSQASAIIEAYAAANQVAVYKTLSDTYCDVRYTLRHKPRIAILDDGGTEGIHISVFEDAGIPASDYSILNAASMSSLAETSCYTIATAPHYLPYMVSENGRYVALMSLHSSAELEIASVRAFLLGGGNLFAQCGSIGTYENQETDGLFQTSAGITLNNVDDPLGYPNADTPLNQFHGDINGNESGVLSDYRLLGGSSYHENAYPIARSDIDQSIFTASAGKLEPNRKGSFIGYLGGHDYSVTNRTADINGRRILLNALFIPSLRPAFCDLNFGSDLSVVTEVSSEYIYHGDPLIYTITVSNQGPQYASGLTVQDLFPAGVTGVTWQMTGTPGVLPAVSSGSGDINVEIDIPLDGVATFVAHGYATATACDPFDPDCTVVNGARAFWNFCSSDLNSANNLGMIRSSVFRSVMAGEVRRDDDNDGDPADEDIGLPGIAISLWSDPNADGDQADGYILERAITDTRGRFAFTELPAGHYVLEMETSAGLTCTADLDGAADGIKRVALTVGAYMSGNDFLIHANSDLFLNYQVEKLEQVDPGDHLRYTIALFNAGLIDQTNLRIVTPLSDSLEYNPDTSVLTEYGGPVEDSVVDSFSTATYTNGLGGPIWSTAWIETGENDGAGAGAIAVRQSAPAEVLTNAVIASADTHIILSRPSRNYANSRSLVIAKSSSDEYRALLSFSLEGLDADKNISKAELVVVASGSAPAVHVHAVNRDWTESSADWANMSSGYDPDVQASMILSAGVSRVDITPLVRAWADGSVENRGIMLRLTANGEVSLKSRENSGQEPRLLVTQSSSSDSALAFSGTGGRSIHRGVDLSDYTSAVLRFSYDLRTANGGDFIAVGTSTNGINWVNLLNIRGHGAGEATVDLASALFSNTRIRFRNEGFGSAAGEIAFLDDITVTGTRQGMTTDAGPPPEVISGHTLGPSRSLSVTFDTIVTAPVDEILSSVCIYSDQYPDGLCESIITTLGFAQITNAALTGSGQNLKIKLEWDAGRSRVSPPSHDVIYQDSSTGFRNETRDGWELLETVPGGTNKLVHGMDGALPLYGVPADTFRLFRLARNNRWQQDKKYRSASREVYAFKNILLKPGENFVSLFAVPEENNLAFVLGTNRLPAGATLAESTRVEWYGATADGASTSMVWLSSSGYWLHGNGGGVANNMQLPLHEGFNVILPSDAPTQLLPFLGKIPREHSSLYGTEAPVKAGRYNIVSAVIPSPIKLGESGLREAGFTGTTGAQPLNPMYSDEIRILQKGGGSMAAPSVRIIMNSSGTFVYWTGGSKGASAEGYLLQPDDSYILYARRSTNDFTWAPTFPYAPPTRDMNP